jgi:hypothetical protein
MARLPRNATTRERPLARKLAHRAMLMVFGAMLMVIVPIVIAIFAFGCFVVAGLFTGMVFGVLDFLGLLKWSDTTFLIVTVPVAVVVAVWGVIHRDDLS